jgi:hypothetical protein
MDEQGSGLGSDEQQYFQKLTSYYDAPAFVRRVKRVEESYQLLLEHLARQRDEQLAIVRLRVGQLTALAGEWSALRPIFAFEEDIARLRDLHGELQPKLRLPLEPTAVPRVLRAAAQELIEANELFNARWRRRIDKLDLTFINQLRDGYNRHYLLEKECSLGSARVARVGFRPLEPLTGADLFQIFPPLPVPTLS